MAAEDHLPDFPWDARDDLDEREASGQYDEEPTEAQLERMLNADSYTPHPPRPDTHIGFVGR